MSVPLFTICHLCNELHNTFCSVSIRCTFIAKFPQTAKRVVSMQATTNKKMRTYTSFDLPFLFQIERILCINQAHSNLPINARAFSSTCSRSVLVWLKQAVKILFAVVPWLVSTILLWLSSHRIFSMTFIIVFSWTMSLNFWRCFYLVSIQSSLQLKHWKWDLIMWRKQPNSNRYG